ncbi:unnamed protein product [Cercospora beticola]|nr:unnamed protein product [Cercospora beticola]
MGRVRQLHCQDIRFSGRSIATKQLEIERFAWTVHRGSALNVARQHCGDRCRHVCWLCMLRIQSRRLDNTAMHVLSVATALCPPAQLEQGTGSMAAPTARESGVVPPRGSCQTKSRMSRCRRRPDNVVSCGVAERFAVPINVEDEE